MRKIWLGLIGLIGIAYIGHLINNYFILDHHATHVLIHKINIQFNKSLWLTILDIHIISTSLTILTGLLGFSKRIRIRNKALHRWIGYLYIIMVMIGSLTAGYLAPYATGGRLDSVGFNLLNIVWLVTTGMAWIKIRKKQTLLHRIWMIRSYSLCFANTTIHVVMLIATSLFSLHYVRAYEIGVWSCWIINLAIAEVIIRMTNLNKRKTIL